jgi:hypothetical protein
MPLAETVVIPRCNKKLKNKRYINAEIFIDNYIWSEEGVFERRISADSKSCFAHSVSACSSAVDSQQRAGAA